MEVESLSCVLVYFQKLW